MADFPRGGTTVKRDKSETKPRSGEKDLFKITSAEGKKKPKKKTKGQVKVKPKTTQKSPAFANDYGHHGRLTPKLLADGSLILGIIKQISDYELKVSLPNGMTGNVPITNICDAYSSLLRNLAEEESNQPEPHSLEELFRVGDVLRCKVLSPGLNADASRKPVTLTINPRDLNISFRLEDLRKNMVLCGCVSSLEDHGYVIDLGITGVNGFLKKKDAKKMYQAEQDRQLDVGSYVNCMINMDYMNTVTEGGRSIPVVVDPKKIDQLAVIEATNWAFDRLIPGMIIQGKVKKALSDEILVDFAQYTFTINRSHLDQSLGFFTAKQTIKCCILYVNPLSKKLSLTRLKHFLSPETGDLSLLESAQVGEILEGEILRIDASKGAYLLFPDKIKGYCNRAHTMDNNKQDAGVVIKKGMKKKCRILDVDLNDMVLKVTMRENDLEKNLIKYDDLKPAQVVQCTILRILDDGLSVKVADNVFGFIPKMQLADSPTIDVRKRFKDGQEIKCKVLTVEPEKKRLILTHKKSLLNSKFPDVTGYDVCESGETVQGFIATVQRNGLLVVFYNNVKGWVPKQELSAQEIGDPRNVFYIGQVVRCKIKNVKPDEEKMILTFTMTEKARVSVSGVSADFRPGHVMDCMVTSVTSDGVHVHLKQGEKKHKGFIPKHQLSEHPAHYDQLLKLYKKDDLVKDAMYTGGAGEILLTRKRLLIESLQNADIPAKFAELKTGLVLNGIVKKIMPYGIFVDCFNGLNGLAPNKMLTDWRMENAKDLYDVGDHVSTKVMEIDEEKQRFLLSLRPADNPQKTAPDDAILLVSTFLEERALIYENLKQGKGPIKVLVGYKVGQIVEVQVEKLNEFGVLCKLKNKTKGFATFEHVGGRASKVGDKISAVVLHVDLAGNCLELSLKEDLCKAIQHRLENKFSIIKVGQTVKSECLLIKDEFVLVALKGHAAGKLAFIPAKLHRNDKFHKNRFVVGQINATVIKRADEDESIIANLQIYENENQLTSSKDEIAKSKASGSPKLGQIITARVRSVQPLQMNVVFGSHHGRVHVSEVKDDPTPGEFVLSEFTEKQTISVKVIGFRDPETHRYIEDGKVGNTKVYMECSMRKSKLSHAGFKSSDGVETAASVGEQIPCYVSGCTDSVVWVHVTPRATGKIPASLSSQSEQVLLNPGEFFKTGKSLMAHVLDVNEDTTQYKLSVIDSTSEFEKGQTVTATVVDVKEGRGLIVKLSDQHKGLIPLTEISDDFPDKPTDAFCPDQTVQAKILAVKLGDQHKYILSSRASRLSRKAKKSKAKNVLDNAKQVKVGSVVDGYVTSTNAKGIFISLCEDVVGRASFDHVSEFYIQSPEVMFYPGRLVRSKVTSFEKKEMRIGLSLLEKDSGVELDFGKLAQPRKVHVTKSKGQVEDVEMVEDPRNTATTTKATKTKTKPAQSLTVTQKPETRKRKISDSEPKKSDNKKGVEKESLGADFSWSEMFSLPSEITSEKQTEEETHDLPEKKAKINPQTEEESLYQMELANQGADAPKCVSDYEKLVMQSPNCSLMWIKYMAFYMQQLELDKARGIAERALKTISFREEDEKFNVWLALMNLENTYGSNDTLKAVFERAQAYTEPAKLYHQLALIYEKSNQPKLAEDLYNVMIRKFGQNKDVWINFGLFLFKQGNSTMAHTIMHKSLKSLPKVHHVHVLSKYAQFEFVYGEAERGKTVFDNILSNYPKRTDIWSLYVDMLVKINEIDHARLVLERQTQSSLPAKKLKTALKKWLDFEDKNGTADTVRAVKEKAASFVHDKEN